MSRFLPVLVLLSACVSDATLSAANAEGWENGLLRIVTPRSGDFLEIESPQELQAELTGPEGEIWEFDEIVWTTDQDSEFALSGPHVPDADFTPGVHEITAEVILPNGDRLAHTIGGVRVQSRYAGTYAGLFSANVETQGIQAPCSGSAVVVVDVTGESANGSAACVAGLQGIELDLAFIIDLDNDLGDVSGVAAADLFGFFQYDFPAEGTIEPEGAGLDLTFGGDAFGQLIVDGRVEAPRVSLEAAE
ncbi:MAG: hypothetical protein KC912_08245 [Proteobacteria bacterium]|nr:hypothetical protein [Pseudomonadota bacterium]